MAISVLPAVARSGVAVARQMPGLITRMTKYTPSVASALSKLTGSTTPAALAKAISEGGNGMQAQALIMNAVRAGATPEFIRGAVPLLGPLDMTQLAAHHVEYAQRSRGASDAVALPHPVIAGEAPPPSAEVVRAIELTCDDLNVSSDRLIDIIATFKSLTSADVLAYKKYMMKIGRAAV